VVVLALPVIVQAERPDFAGRYAAEDVAAELHAAGRLPDQAALLAAAPAKAGSPQTPAAPAGQGVSRFRRIRIEDRQVIGGEAVSFLVPTE
jgi:hypothetical protein